MKQTCLVMLLLSIALAGCEGVSTPYPTPYPTATKPLPITIEIVAPYRGQEPSPTPIPIPTLLPVSSDAFTMLEYINASRQEHGLPVLTLDSTLSYLAQLRAEDLIHEYRIDHQTPSYGYLDEMLPGTGVNCCQIGENIGRTTSLERGHEGMMDSVEHRENILVQNFTSIGIGIASRGSRVIIVEIFCAAPDASMDCTW